jgi:hypothetical protein
MLDTYGTAGGNDALKTWAAKALLDVRKHFELPSLGVQRVAVDLTLTSPDLQADRSVPTRLARRISFGSRLPIPDLHRLSATRLPRLLPRGPAEQAFLNCPILYSRTHSCAVASSQIFVCVE